MVADMPEFGIGNSTNAKITAYADDSTVYVRAKNVDSLKCDLERISDRMISIVKVLD